MILTLTDEHFPNRALPPLPWWTELTAPSQGEGSVGKRDGGKAGGRVGGGGLPGLSLPSFSYPPEPWLCFETPAPSSGQPLPCLGLRSS